MTRDKKTVAGQVSWVLLEGPGRAGVHRDVSPKAVEQVVSELRE
jgi:3-dehydroquinate synthetase